MNKSLLVLAWKNLMIDMSIRADFIGTFRWFERCYEEDGRYYHTLEHIDACFDEFVRVRSLLEHPNEVALAIWFHDLVYDTHQNDNEEKSALEALMFCFNSGLERSAGRVQQLVLATRHATGASDWTSDTCFLVDIDLSILGKSESVFTRYEHQIRREYRWVAEADFRMGRTRILESFLARQNIYHTDHFRTKYEEQARKNLARSIEKLRSS